MKQQFKKCLTLITIVMMIITMMPRLAHAEDSDPTTVVETEQIETINDQSEIVEETDKEEVVEEVLEEVPVEVEVVQEEPKEDTIEESVPFEESQTVDGVLVTVKAEEGAFPEGSTLSVRKVNSYEERKVEEAIEEHRDNNTNVVSSYTFDIKVLDKDSNEIQPQEGKKVEVSFKLEEIANENLDTNIYHIQEDTLDVEALDTQVEEDTVVVETEGFSYYTVEFTYNNLEYSIKGGSVVAISAILENIGLTGTVTNAVSSNPDLFSVDNSSGEWVLKSLQAFNTHETLKVTLDGVEYVIEVTDDQHSHSNGTHGVNKTWSPWNSATSLPTSGTYYLNTDVTIAKDKQITTTGELHLCLNGHSIRAEIASFVYLFTIGGAHEVCIYDSEDNSGVIYSSGGIVSTNADNLYNSFTLNGGILDGSIGTSARSRVVFLQNKGTFNMNGGVIRNFTVRQAVVLVNQNSTFNMAGGSITGNKSTATSDSFGSVVGFNGSGSTLVANLTGGTITGNTSTTDGVGAIHVYNEEKVNISGNVIITGNTTNGTECNVYVKNFYNDRFINITGNLGSKAKIGITSQKAPTEINKVKLTKGLNTQGTLANFTSDNPDYSVVIENNEAYLMYHVHKYNYTLKDGGYDTIIAECIVENCPLTENPTVKILPPTLETYGGEGSPEATLEGEIPSVTLPSVVYKKGDQVLSTAPTDAGNYRAQITLKGENEVSVTAYVDYTIEKADISPVVNIDGWNYGEDPNEPSVTAASNPGSGGVTYKYYTDEQCTTETDTAQGASEAGGVPAKGGDYWVKATVAETDNYKSGTGTKKFTIATKAITVTGLKVNSKVYDGNTDATLDFSEATLVGVQDGDDVRIASATGTFDTKDVGTEKTISNIVIELVGDDAGGYSATSDPATKTGAITPKPVTVEGITSSNKVYDGNTTATVDTSEATFTEKVEGDELTVSTTGTFDNKNVGTGKTVNLGTLTLGGSAAGNYTVKDDSQTTTKANITAKPVTVAGITASNKVYDGNTTATVDTSEATFDGIVGEDKLTVTTTGSFSDKNVGTGKTVAFGTLTLGGEDVSNYELAATGNQPSTTADITAKEIVVSGITSPGKVYDGTTTAPLNLVGATLTGKVDGDNLSITADGNFESANVGEDKTVNISGLELTGEDKNNYVLAEEGQQAETTATIAPKELTSNMLSVDPESIKNDGTKKGPNITLNDKEIDVDLTDEDYKLSGETESDKSGTHFFEVEGKGNYTGTLSSSWVMYENRQNHDKQEGTYGKGDIEIFVDVIGNTENITVDNFTIDFAKKLLSEEDLERYNNGENVLIYVELKEESKDDVDTKDKELVLSEFNRVAAKDIRWFDITVWKRIGNDKATQVHDTVDNLEMTISVPDEYKNAPADNTRTFYLARSHDGEADILTKTNEKKVGLSSNKFSIYALAYKDTYNGGGYFIPKTGD